MATSKTVSNIMMNNHQFITNGSHIQLNYTFVSGCLKHLAHNIKTAYDFIPANLSENDHWWLLICHNFQMTFVSSFLEAGY
jgi:hypothetical protein